MFSYVTTSWNIYITIYRCTIRYLGDMEVWVWLRWVFLLPKVPPMPLATNKAYFKFHVQRGLEAIHTLSIFAKKACMLDGHCFKIVRQMYRLILWAVMLVLEVVYCTDLNDKYYKNENILWDMATHGADYLYLCTELNGPVGGKVFFFLLIRWVSDGTPLIMSNFSPS